MIRRFHDAREEGRDEVVVWGTGAPRREFLHVDDLADACVFLMQRYGEPGHINVGTGEDVSIRELAEMVRRIVHPAAKIMWDGTKPDGTPRKLLDVTRLHNLGWRHRISLGEGIESTYQWFLTHRAELRGVGTT
jgi:GDP-L-fucose synthase